jgi:hypothetical protein
MRNCSDCNIKPAHFGFPDAVASFCSECRKNHVGTVNKRRKMCHNCKIHTPSFRVDGYDDLWCKKCVFSENIPLENYKSTVKLCEDCPKATAKQPTYGLEGGSSRWCRECAEGHEGARLTKKRKRCECGKNDARYSLDDNSPLKWCVDCRPEGTKYKAYLRKCIDCKKKTAHYGMENDQKGKLWCRRCSQAHEGSISLDVK